MSGAAPAGASTMFKLKNLALEPRTRLRRRKYATGSGDIGSVMLEHFHYSDAILDSFARTMEEPDFMHAFALDADSVVIDVGGFVGEWCIPMVQRYGCRIEVYEPAASALQTLRKRTADFPSVHIHDVGLGRADFEARLAEKGPGSTIYESDEVDAEIETVRIRDVVAEFDELGFGNIDLMKINIEGGEYDLLDRLLASDHGARVDQFLIQFHEWLPRAYYRRWRIRRKLRETHELVWDYPWVFEFWVRRDAIGH